MGKIPAHCDLDCFRLKVAANRNNNVSRNIVALVIIECLLHCDRVKQGPISADRMAIGVFSVYMFKNRVNKRPFRVVAVHVQFAADNVLFIVKRFLFEFIVENNRRQEPDCIF